MSDILHIEPFNEEHRPLRYCVMDSTENECFHPECPAGKQRCSLKSWAGYNINLIKNIKIMNILKLDIEVRIPAQTIIAPIFHVDLGWGDIHAIKNGKIYVDFPRLSSDDIKLKGRKGYRIREATEMCHLLPEARLMYEFSILDPDLLNEESEVLKEKKTIKYVLFDDGDGIIHEYSTKLNLDGSSQTIVSLLALNHQRQYPNEVYPMTIIIDEEFVWTINRNLIPNFDLAREKDAK